MTQIELSIFLEVYRVRLNAKEGTFFQATLVWIVFLILFHKKSLMFEFAFSQYENYIQLRNNLLAMSLLQTQLLSSNEALPMSLSPGLQFNVNEPHRHKYIFEQRGFLIPQTWAMNLSNLKSSDSSNLSTKIITSLLHSAKMYTHNKNTWLGSNTHCQTSLNSSYMVEKHSVSFTYNKGSFYLVHCDPSVNGLGHVEKSRLFSHTTVLFASCWQSKQMLFYEGIFQDIHWFISECHSVDWEVALECYLQCRIKMGPFHLSQSKSVNSNL